MDSSENPKKASEKAALRRKKAPQSNCETCVHFDWDDWYEDYVCKQDLDEDEMVRYLAGNFASCPYYRFYDEYKSVQKQN